MKIFGCVATVSHQVVDVSKKRSDVLYTLSGKGSEIQGLHQFCRDHNLQPTDLSQGKFTVAQSTLKGRGPSAATFLSALQKEVRQQQENAPLLSR